MVIKIIIKRFVKNVKLNIYMIVQIVIDVKEM